MHAVLPGISKNQMMARHKANHIQVVYADSKAKAIEAAKSKATVINSLGIKTFICGDLD
jgi:hypothetical protein